MANPYLLNIHTITILIIILILTYISYSVSNREGFYFSYFPPNPKEKRSTLMDDNSSKSLYRTEENKQITFNFPEKTSRESMIAYVANYFKSKIGGIYKNVIHIRIERMGKGSSEFNNQSAFTNLTNKITDADYDKVFLNIGYIRKDRYKYSDFGKAGRTKYITTPQTMIYEKIPLQFGRNSVTIDLDKKTTPIPIMYFMHYWFDPFYCRGRSEKPLKVHGYNQKDNVKENIHKYVVDVGDISDSLWGADSSKIQGSNLFITKDKNLEPDVMNVEPDSDSRNRCYKTPSKRLNKCNVMRDYIKKWDARGVPIEKVQEDIDMKDYMFHPAMVQNKLDGLYDDVFDMSRIIPSFPTGRASSGR